MKASVVIPSYNCAAFLAHAVNSAQKQNFANLEIVVVDDGSTDSTRQLMHHMANNDARIKYVRLDANVGRSEARNIGNRTATGDFIMVLDADDIAYPDRAKLTAAKIKSGADFVHGSCQFIDAIGSLIGDHKADVFTVEKALTEKVNRMVHSTCAYTRDLAQENQYRGGEISRLGIDDWAFQLDCAYSGAQFDHISVPVGAYRDLETGISNTRNPEEVMAAKDKFLSSLAVNA
jgi:glycosyltransferase involved in cell wall biosynthesis